MCRRASSPGDNDKRSQLPEVDLAKVSQAARTMPIGTYTPQLFEKFIVKEVKKMLRGIIDGCFSSAQEKQKKDALCWSKALPQSLCPALTFPSTPVTFGPV